MLSQVQRPSFAGPPPWRLSSDYQTNTIPKSNSSTLFPYIVTIIYYRDEPRWLDSTRCHTMPNPRDMVTVMGKAELHPKSGNYTAAEIASCALLSNFDSTANPRTPTEESELLYGMIARLDQAPIRHPRFNHPMTRKCL